MAAVTDRRYSRRNRAPRFFRETITRFMVMCASLAIMKRLLPIAIAFVSSIALGEVDWPDLKFTKIASGAVNPDYVTGAGDGSGRLFVVEQHGRIRIADGNGGYLATPFLDISDRVSNATEQGLLSVAFPPGFATSQHFYVNYTGANGDTF